MITLNYKIARLHRNNSENGPTSTGNLKISKTGCYETVPMMECINSHHASFEVRIGVEAGHVFRCHVVKKLILFVMWNKL